MTRLLVNYDLHRVLGQAIASARHRLFIATADLKDVHLPVAGQRAAVSIVRLLHALGRRGVEVRILHGGIPSGPFLREIKRYRPSIELRRCPRVHAKAVIVDGRAMYLGSANLTGAGLGAKSPSRRNFEAGIWTDDLPTIDAMQDMLESVWNGSQCAACGRTEFCPVPLEQPARHLVPDKAAH